MKMRMSIVVSLVLCLIAGPAYAKKDKGKHKHKSLPPGLQKKAARGKPLPPGWQKKLSRGDILDDSIYARGTIVAPLGKDGSISIEVEGTILRLHNKTRRIINILQQ